jgi:hypothetical protein
MVQVLALFVIRWQIENRLRHGEVAIQGSAPS